ncbi:hypothetical protein HAX54_009788, partial [Datura stramonium]|nr:hypothetical protein [Datura stramonium]
RKIWFEGAVVLKSRDNPMWRFIRAHWPLFAANLDIIVGNKRKKPFSSYNWIGRGPLEDMFNDMKTQTLNPEATVEENWDQQGWR